MTLPGQDTSPSQVNSPANAGTQAHLNSLSQAEASGIKCIAQVHNTVDRSWIEPQKTDHELVPISTIPP